MSILNWLLFWAAAALCALAIFMIRARKPAARAERPLFSEKNQRAVLILLAVIAIAVRVWRFGDVPGGLNQDGAMAAVDAKALADYGTDRLGMRYPVFLTAWGVAQMSALLSYILIPFVKLFGLSAVVIRLPQLLISLTSLWCLYLFVKDVFGREVGLIFYALGAINPWHIVQSRWALEANLYPHFFVFGIFFLNLALKEKRRKLSLCLSMIMFGLCMYCYGVSIYTMPLFLLAACVYLLVKKQVDWREAGLAFAVYLLVAWPFILCMVINTFGWETIRTPLFTIPYFPDSVRSSDILFFSENPLPQLLENLKSLLNITLLQKKDLPWSDVEGFGTMYLFSMPFAALGLVGLFLEYRKKPGAALALFYLLTGVWCGLVTRGVNVNRLNIIYYSILMLIALGVYECVRWVNCVPKLEYGVAAGYLVAFVLFTHTYFTTFAEDIRWYFFQDFTEAVTALKNCDARKQYITTDWFSGSAACGEILTLFCQEIDARYYQGLDTPEGELPYAEKYTYQNLWEVSLDFSEDAAYVCSQSELALFPEGYEVTQYGSVYTVMK